jgi:hypothetical protein
VTVNQRIKELDFFEKKRGNKLYSVIGVSASTLSVCINGKKGKFYKPGYNLILSIFRAYENKINPNWLFFGKGNMWLGQWQEDGSFISMYTDPNISDLKKEIKKLRDQNEEYEKGEIENLRLINKLTKSTMEVREKYKALYKKYIKEGDPDDGLDLSEQSY